MTISETQLRKLIKEESIKCLNEEGWFGDVTGINQAKQAVTNAWNNAKAKVGGAASTVSSAVGNTVQSGAEQAVSLMLRKALASLKGLNAASPNNTYYKNALTKLNGVMSDLKQASSSNMQQIKGTAAQSAQNIQNVRQQGQERMDAERSNTNAARNNFNSEMERFNNNMNNYQRQ